MSIHTAMIEENLNQREGQPEPNSAGGTGGGAVLDVTPCSALAAKWGRQAEMLLAQKKDFVDRGYSSSLIQLWDTVAGVLNDCKTKLEEAIYSQNS